MCVSVLTMAVCMAAGAQADWTVDHRYAPVTWQTCIGLPDDWQKTLVGNDGALLYDYPGPFADFSIRLLCGAAEPAEFVNQSLLDPRVPIVRTVRRRGELTCTEEAFAVAPRPAVAEAKAPGLERIGPPDVIPGHARPAAACLPAFRDIAVGWNRPIQYRFHCEPGGRYTVVFGLCEGWWGEAGHRIQVLTAEGAEPSTVDLAATPGQNQPAVYRFEAEDRDRDGRLDLTVAAAPEATDTNTVLSALWVFAPGQAPSDADLIAGRATGSLDFVACGSAAPAGPPRHDLLLVRWHNAGAAAARVAPTLTIQSTLPPEADGDRRLRLGPDSAVSFAAPVTLVAAGDRQWTVALTPIDLPPGGEALVPILVARGRAVLDVPCRLDDALDWRRRAERYWRDADLPYGRIRVPDAGIQAQLDSAVRNIYQAREIKQDLPAFQVGPTCYRGLWVVDGSFLLEAISYLGREAEARQGIAYLRSFQRPDGAVEIITGHLKETGIALWAAWRHAQLTGDRDWLRGMWPPYRRAVAHLQDLRRQASQDPNALYAGLIPPGFSDGGIGGTNAEYTNVYWNLAGLRAAVEAATWLGEQDDLTAWSREYDEFRSAFDLAAARDEVPGPGGACLPILMGRHPEMPVQKAQWAFCHAVFPGRVFDRHDPLVAGNLAMLKANECEGLVRDTGWLGDGVWNYFASFYAHAWLWQGDGGKAAETLYAFANHASPLLCWREEQMPVGKGGAMVGDMPHNWASAEFIRLVRHLLVLERGDELHLCEGLPAKWVEPGMTTRLDRVPTSFGRVSLTIEAAQDGRSVKVTCQVPSRTPPRRVLLHLGTWTGQPGFVAMANAGTQVRVVGK